VLEQAKPADAGQRLLGQVPTASGVLRLYRGDLTDPLLRIDDYPTGVRPILQDLSSLHDVLKRVDDSGLEFHLGIVPAIVEDRMEGFLRSLQHLSCRCTASSTATPSFRRSCSMRKIPSINAAPSALR